MTQKLASFYLAHMNDTHSHIDGAMVPLHLSVPEGSVDFRLQCGGFPRIATFVKQARYQASREHVPLFFLDAGDTFQGTMFYSCFKGLANVTLLNQLNIDAMTIGNHELDTGNTPLYHFLEHSHFPLLAGNWDLSSEAADKPTRMHGHPRMVSWQNPAHPQPFIVKWINDIPVAIFGLVLDTMAEIAAPDGDSTFLPIRNSARTIVRQIKAAGIRHCILLSHLGYERDCQLAREVPDIALIVGGHTHTLQGDFSSLGLMNQHPYGERVGDTLILQAGYNALMIGLARIGLLDDGRMVIERGQNHLLTSDDASLLSQQGDSLSVLKTRKIRHYLGLNPLITQVKPDRDMDRFIEQHYRQKLSRFTSDRVVSLPKGLRHVRIPDELGGSQVAPLVAESMLYQAHAQGIDIDLALFNAGGARISLPPGTVTAAELAGRLLPFASTISYFTIEGEQIRLALEGAIINALECGGSGSFPYPANLRYSYRAFAPKGERITELWIKDKHGHWQPLREQQPYSLITTSYTAMGKEGYQALQYSLTPPRLLGPILSEAFINFARFKQTLMPPAEPLYRLELLQPVRVS